LRRDLIDRLHDEIDPALLNEKGVAVSDSGAVGFYAATLKVSAIERTSLLVVATPYLLSPFRTQR